LMWPTHPFATPLPCARHRRRPSPPRRPAPVSPLRRRRTTTPSSRCAASPVRPSWRSCACCSPSHSSRHRWPLWWRSRPWRRSSAPAPAAAPASRTRHARHAVYRYHEAAATPAPTRALSRQPMAAGASTATPSTATARCAPWRSSCPSSTPAHRRRRHPPPRSPGALRPCHQERHLHHGAMAPLPLLAAAFLPSPLAASVALSSRANASSPLSSPSPRGGGHEAQLRHLRPPRRGAGRMGMRKEKI
jgi:serine/arginine repetitive matrix protein 1